MKYTCSTVDEMYFNRKVLAFNAMLAGNMEMELCEIVRLATECQSIRGIGEGYLSLYCLVYSDERDILKRRVVQDVVGRAFGCCKGVVEVDW